MVPSAFVPIAAIPLNRNGKLDANALPSPDLRDGHYLAPRTPTEELVAALFAEVLELERCGALDHFFELGGHSLLAASLVSKLRSRGIVIPLRAVFDTPSVEGLSRRIDASSPSGDAVPVEQQPRPADIPLSFPQERIWFVDRLRQDSSYNIPIAFELRGLLNVEAAAWALQRIIGRHEALRTRIVLRQGRPVQEITSLAPFELRRVEIPEASLRDYLHSLAAYRLDLESGTPSNGG